MSIEHLDNFEVFFDELHEGCCEMGIYAQAATSECGIGLFEITLTHCDEMRKADNTWLFKSLKKSLKRKHKMAATLMAKPFLQDAGNGLNLHFSETDKMVLIFLTTEPNSDLFC